MSRRQTWWVRHVWNRFRENRLGAMGLGLVGVFALAALSHPILMGTVWDKVIYDPIHGHDSIIVELEIVDEVTDPASQIGVMQARLQDPRLDVGDVYRAVSLPESFTLCHPLGVDNLGRDVLSMVLTATAPSFVVGLSAAITTAIVGVVLASLCFIPWVL